MEEFEEQKAIFYALKSLEDLGPFFYPEQSLWCLSFQKRGVLSDDTLPDDIRIALAQNMHNDLFFQACKLEWPTRSMKHHSWMHDDFEAQLSKYSI